MDGYETKQKQLKPKKDYLDFSKKDNYNSESFLLTLLGRTYFGSSAISVTAKRG